MEDHPGTGVWSVVCWCSNVTVSAQGVTPIRSRLIRERGSVLYLGMAKEISILPY